MQKAKRLLYCKVLWEFNMNGRSRDTATAANQQQI
jgi:hypothetical protein